MNYTTSNRPYWIHRNPRGTYAVKVIMGSKNVILYEAGDPIIRFDDDPNGEDWFIKEDFTCREAAEAFIAGMELATCNPIHVFAKVGVGLEFVQDQRPILHQKSSRQSFLLESREEQTHTQELPYNSKRRTELPNGYRLVDTYRHSCPQGEILMETYGTRYGKGCEYYKYYWIESKDKKHPLSGFVKNRVHWIEIERRARRIAKYCPRRATLNIYL